MRFLLHWNVIGEGVTHIPLLLKDERGRWRGEGRGEKRDRLTREGEVEREVEREVESGEMEGGRHIDDKSGGGEGSEEM